jgi:putative transposase
VTWGVSVPDERALAHAAFRHRLIAEAIEAGREGVADALREAAARAHLDPRGRCVRVTVRTLWRWLAAYRRGGLLALCPHPRKDKGRPRVLDPRVLRQVEHLRREKPTRPTKTVIDILVRTRVVAPGVLARSTLDRHFERAGLSRRALRTLGHKTFVRIETQSPFELVVGDFHHGPYVRVGDDDGLHRALLCAFIDHFSRFVPEGRYYLHEDFAALRFGFRRLLLAHGLPVSLYLDNGPAFHATRFHAACDALDVRLVHSKAYQKEGRGVVERFNRTVKEQFEDEVRGRDEPLVLDELNAYFEAWLAERYHRDVHSETAEPPRERFARGPALRPAPDLALVEELLRLRERRTVHKKWSTVELAGGRYAVEPALRGRRVEVLFDPFDLTYVLVAFDGRLVQRAFPHKPGERPPEPPPAPTPDGPPLDYLALLRADYERRTAAELASLHLRAAPPAPELTLVDLVALLERCRGATLSDAERSEAAAFWRRLRPIEPAAARSALERAQRRLGGALHLRVYLDALKDHLVRLRTKGAKKP